MPTITVLPEGKAIQAAEGTKLLQALLDNAFPLSHRCSGNLSCGTCHVFIHDGRKTVSRIAPGENAMLDSIPGVGSKSRLACQVTLGSEDISVELLGFASGG